MIQVVPATLEHCLHVADNLRPLDWQELIALNDHSPRRALAESFGCSVMVWAGLVDDDVALVFGVGEVSETIGAPWMLGTHLVEKEAKSFLRQCRGYVDQMQAAYPLLTNCADQRNRRTLAWLRWLGFTLHDPIPFGRFGLPFVPFSRQQTCVIPQPLCWLSPQPPL